jgi:hypothetical protein
LTVDRWEHTPEWQLTSKFLISKHQQVQLLEAARVLMDFKKEDAIDADPSAISPRAPGAPDDYLEESEESPSPRPEGDVTESDGPQTKRLSSNSSTYSRSYESSVFSDGRGLASHRRQWSSDANGRPTTSGTSVTSSLTDDELEQTAATLLSCSYGRRPSVLMQPVFGQDHAMSDVPPVPPVPARFQLKESATLTDNQLSGSGSTIRGGTVLPASYDSNVRGERFGTEDVEMEDEDDTQSHVMTHGPTRHLEEDYGIFGRMDE